MSQTDKYVAADDYSDPLVKTSIEVDHRPVNDFELLAQIHGYDLPNDIAEQVGELAKEELKRQSVAAIAKAADEFDVYNDPAVVFAPKT